VGFLPCSFGRLVRVLRRYLAGFDSNYGRVAEEKVGN
jgi:hypothetical protein